MDVFCCLLSLKQVARLRRCSLNNSSPRNGSIAGSGGHNEAWPLHRQHMIFEESCAFKTRSKFQKRPRG
jgi:hypothetical protein